MTDRPPDLNEKVDSWLEGLGFGLGNPFASVEAEQERELLPRFFVDVPEIDEIKGSSSIIIFAPRGGGKSALRVMLADRTAPRDLSQSILSVEFTDFDRLLDHYRQKSLDSHVVVQGLLEAGLETLLHCLLRRRGTAVSEMAKIQLARFLKQYAPFLLTPETLLRTLKTLSPDMTLEKTGVSWAEFGEYVAGKKLTQLVVRLGDSSDIRLLAELNDFATMATAVPASPVRQMESFYELCQGLGFSAVFFLLDRVDEFPDTADNPELQAQLLAPLLGHLPLLEMDGLAFKFFLPDMIRPELDWLRLDRIRIKAATLKWQGERLLALLNERLRVFSDRRVTDLSQICESRVDADIIEKWLVSTRSPRQLLLAIQTLCEAHVLRAGPTGLLTREDWRLVQQDESGDDKADGAPVRSPEVEENEAFFTAAGAPLLRIHLAQHRAWLGSEPLDLTPIQFRILEALVARDGRCSYEDLASSVWPDDVQKEGIQDDRISRNISRLREGLHDSGNKQFYLKTIRGWGLALQNHAVAD